MGSQGFCVPMPGVLESLNLAGRICAVLLVEECVVVLGRIERGVQIDEVHRFVLQIPPQDVQIVAVIKRAHAPSVAGSSPEGNAPRSRDSGPIHETKYRRRRRASISPPY